MEFLNCEHLLENTEEAPLRHSFSLWPTVLEEEMSRWVETVVWAHHPSPL